MKSKENIEFIIRGSVNDTEINPSSVPLFLLEAFTTDVSAILNSAKDDKKEEIIVSVEPGSLKIIALISLAIYGSLNSEISQVYQKNSLDGVKDRRAKIITNWVSLTKKYPYLEFEIKTGNETSLIINNSTEFKQEVEDLWFEGVYSLYGTINDMGGETNSNIHFKTDSGKAIKIDCKKSDLESETENRIYKFNAIKVSAEQNLITGELRNAKFISFLDYNPNFNEEKLLTIFERGREAWKDVQDHVGWIRNLRSDNE